MMILIAIVPWSLNRNMLLRVILLLCFTSYPNGFSSKTVHRFLEIIHSPNMMILFQDLRDLLHYGAETDAHLICGMKTYSSYFKKLLRVLILFSRSFSKKSGRMWQPAYNSYQTLTFRGWSNSSWITWEFCGKQVRQYCSSIGFDYLFID